MNAQERKDLLVAAAKVRLGIIEGVYHAKSPAIREAPSPRRTMLYLSLLSKR